MLNTKYKCGRWEQVFGHKHKYWTNENVDLIMHLMLKELVKRTIETIPRQHECLTRSVSCWDISLIFTHYNLMVALQEKEGFSLKTMNVLDTIKSIQQLSYSCVQLVQSCILNNNILSVISRHTVSPEKSAWTHEWQIIIKDSQAHTFTNTYQGWTF